MPLTNNVHSVGAPSRCYHLNNSTDPPITVATHTAHSAHDEKWAYKRHLHTNALALSLRYNESVTEWQ